MSDVPAGKVALATVQSADQHREVVDITTTKRPHVLMVVANPTTATTTGWPVGFWASELTHPYYEFTRVRYDVTIASPKAARSSSTRSPIPVTRPSGRLKI